MTGLIDPVALATALIRRPSVTPRDEGALAVLAQALEPHGFTCHPVTFSAPETADIANLFAHAGGAGGRHFCFAGHTDVVPSGDPAAWSADPFGGEIRDGKLYGRGAVDMKGGIAAFAAAASRFLAEAGPDFQGRISLAITGDEEGPSINGTAKLLTWMAARGEKLDACLVGEPTSTQDFGDMIKIGRRGSLSGWLTVHGVGGHVAYPHLADNPAHRLITMLADVTTTALDAGNAHFQPSNLQVSSIDIGNPTANVIPAQARAAFNIRFNDGWTPATLEAWLRRRFDAAGGRYDLKLHAAGEAFLTPPGAFAELIAQAVEAETGRRPVFSTTGGTSDARFIHRYCPVAEFGLVGRSMHKIDEAVALDELVALTRIYHDLLRRFFAKD
jgi:succinyl-diaminopimelate desuccinylase